MKSSTHTTNGGSGSYHRWNVVTVTITGSVSEPREKIQMPKRLSKKELARYRCNDCAVNVVEIGEFYMLNPEIWKDELGLGWSDNLCIGCLESRLGRRVGPLFKDFSCSPNYEWMRPTSDRLMDRYGLVKEKGNWRWPRKRKKSRARRS